MLGGKKMIYGYCRISTKKQSIDRQIRNIKAAFPEAVIIEESYTGTSVNRPEWNKLHRQLRENDIIIFDSVSRMSRNASEGFLLYKELFERNVSLVFLKERHIDTEAYREAMKGIISQTFASGDVATDELVNSIMAAIAIAQLKHLDSDNADTSLCPDGWRLPLGAERPSADFSFAYLDTMLGGTGGSQSSATASNNWRKFPNNLVYAGYLDSHVGDTTPYGRGQSGSLWSSSAASNPDAYMIGISDSIIHPGNNQNYKYLGIPIRCISGVLMYSNIQFGNSGDRILKYCFTSSFKLS